jgi:rubredoxin
MKEAQCGDCGLTFNEDDLNDIRQLWERVLPGDIMPAGECPVCGALAHRIKEL